MKCVGWDHECNLGKGEFNNDVRSSQTPGAVCEYTFTGNAIEVIGTKDADMGSMEIFIDGQSQQTVSLAHSSRQTQAVLFKKYGLSYGPHVIKLVNQGEAKVVLDAFNVLP